MNEEKFWQIIDKAWESSPGLMAHRESALSTLRNPGLKDEHEPYIEEEDRLIESLRASLNTLEAEDLLGFDRMLEQKLYNIDREDVHEYTDGSDDGFLYCRGYIVALGRQYYEAVDSDPSKAFCGGECEQITYISYFLYEEKFGEMPQSEICRETQSNKDGWN